MQGSIPYGHTTAAMHEYRVPPAPRRLRTPYRSASLSQQVKHVYERCGFDASSSPTTLYMLSDLEARLEDLLSHIGQMPEEYVAKAEKVWVSK